MKGHDYCDGGISRDIVHVAIFVVVCHYLREYLRKTVVSDGEH